MKNMNLVIGVKPAAPGGEALLRITRDLVRPPTSIFLVSFVQVGTEGDEATRLEGQRQVLETLRASIDQWKIAEVIVKPLVQVGSIEPGRALVKYADQVSADYLIIGLGKRSRVGKALLGSSAQTVVLTASCPVVSVRAQ